VRYEGSIGEPGMGLISVEELGGVREMNSVGIFADLSSFVLLSSIVSPLVLSLLSLIIDLGWFGERRIKRSGRNKYLEEVQEGEKDVLFLELA
jgi:hypothetical protein